MIYLVINIIWVDYTISIPYESSTHVISQKNIWMRFFIQTSIIIIIFKLLKFYFHLKDNKNYARGLCIKIHFTCLSKC